MRLHESDVVTIESLESQNAILLHWHTNPTSEELKFSLNKALELVQQKGIVNWIGNTTHMGAIDPDDQHWVNTEWFPVLLQAGIRNMAVIVPQDIFGQMSVEEIMGQLDLGTGFESRYFDDVTVATHWIEQVAAL